jgi:phosphate transport system substrate-binding protein
VLTNKSSPIESATFLLLPAKPGDPRQSAAVIEFFDWSFTHGSALATQLQYMPLPDAVKAAARVPWNTDFPVGKNLGPWGPNKRLTSVV